MNALRPSLCLLAAILFSSCSADSVNQPEPASNEIFSQATFTLRLDSVIESFGESFVLTHSRKALQFEFGEVNSDQHTLTIIRHDSIGAAYPGQRILDQTLECAFDRSRKTLSLSITELLDSNNYSKNYWYDHQIEFSIKDLVYDSTASGIVARLEGEQVGRLLNVLQWRSYVLRSKQGPGSELRFKEIIPRVTDQLELKLIR